ncbi:hypothetical protein HU761_23125 [Pseudomonas sp. SWRI59]|jgi:hypothetical protein|uniref:type IV secretion protein DotF n=1 Tax=Pseudomonas TaxID=286 RepID=UPI000BA300F3|nr:MULTISPECIES: type IV secretion protein DotF [unclassified Pseudomonas]MBC3479080.1 hypothetical protein [Pseudomonas sp. SWRI77]MBC3504281.1 hypothetical protein [Pseudomonas sp. SWRI59]MBC3509628.1 hypothetical protein [Pseudomonas sp. SWRI68]MDD2062025.1 hypothetical protein [Pseudomonas sp. 25571]UDU80717.1 hypothetical protein LJX93_23520 [Pseudomonas sp. HN2-3]
MKNWSFGKLLGVFAGSFVALILIAVMVMKVSSSPAKAKRMTPAQAQAAQQPRMDVLSIELAKSKEQAQAALEAQQNSEKQLKIVRQESQHNTQLLLNQIKQLDSTLSGLNQRMDYFEASRQRVDIVKPPRKAPVATPAQGLAKGGHAIPQSSGYKVQAIVGHRAWVKSGEREDSVKAGERLPPVQRELNVLAVDGNSGIVVTAPAL